MRKLLLLGGLLLMPVTSWAGAVFADGTFNLAGYSQQVGLENGGATIVASQCANCGASGSLGLELTATFPTAPAPGNLFTTVEVLLNNSFTYAPGTQGAITDLSASVDKNLGVNIALTGGSNTFHPTIEQDGVLYVASIVGPGLNCPTTACQTGYNTLSSALTAASFLQFDPATDTFGTATPNFGGDPITFGLTQIFGSGAAEVITADYDNLSFSINTASAVSEPGMFAIFGIAMLGLVMVRRNKNVVA